MSYILDALKKKETENSEAVPDIKSQHYHSEFEEESRLNLKYVVWIVGLLLLLALFYFAYSLGKQQEVKPVAVAAKEAIEKAAPVESITKNEPNSQANSVTDSAGLKVESKPIELNQPVVKKVAVVSAKPVLEPKTMENNLVDEAPVVSKPAQQVADIQTQSGVISEDFSALPSIRYTSHIYADDPKDRFVMLNGRALGIGQKLPNGVKVLDILENDLLISYKGKRYQIASLADVNQ